MLSETQKLLLAAAVDGELSPDDATAARTLILVNVEAAALYAKLCEDREALRALPVCPAPKALLASVLAALPPTAVPARPTNPPKSPSPRPTHWRSWLPHSLVASFLLVVSLLAYQFALPHHDTPSPAELAEFLPRSDRPLSPRVEDSIPLPLESLIPVEDLPIVPDAGEMPPSPRPAGPVAVKPPETVPPADSPQNLLAAPVAGATRQFDTVTARLPLLIDSSDLTQDHVQKDFRTEISRDGVCRVDVLTRDTGRTVERLTEAAKQLNLNLFTETIAGERLARRLPSVWLIFTDSLTPDDLLAWFSKASDPNLMVNTTEPLPSTHFHILSAGVPDLKDVRDHTGVDLTLGRKTPGAIGPKGISAGTVDQVTAALAKGEGTKTALLVAHLPPQVRAHPALSKEIRQFQEGRRARVTAGTTPVVIYIRPAGR
jgi:hypothetical protein